MARANEDHEQSVAAQTTSILKLRDLIPWDEIPDVMPHEGGHRGRGWLVRVVGLALFAQESALVFGLAAPLLFCVRRLR